MTRQGRRAGPAGEASRRAVTGGIIVTVVGSLAPRSHRRVARRPPRAAAGQLRRPSRYLDPGVPDHERALARRGTTLVGTVKSGALVDVLARGGWLDEAMSRGARLRAARDRRRRRPMERRSPPRSSPPSSSATAPAWTTTCSGGCRRRARITSSRSPAATSRSSPACCSARSGSPAGSAATAMLVVDRRARSRTRALVGGGASVDRATLMAVVYFGARAVDQRSPPLNALARRGRAAGRRPIRCRSPTRRSS